MEAGSFCIDAPSPRPAASQTGLSDSSNKPAKLGLPRASMSSARRRARTAHGDVGDEGDSGGGAQPLRTGVLSPVPGTAAQACMPNERGCMAELREEMAARLLPTLSEVRRRRVDAGCHRCPRGPRPAPDRRRGGRQTGSAVFGLGHLPMLPSADGTPLGPVAAAVCGPRHSAWREAPRRVHSRNDVRNGLPAVWVR